jgi:hypothetical protein
MTAISHRLSLGFLVLTFSFAIGAPKLVTPRELWDFGPLPEGVSVTHIFEVQNEGDETLRIDQLRSNCGCIGARLSGDTIPPGDRAELNLTFHSFRMRGRFSRGVQFLTNDPDRPVAAIRVTGVLEASSFPRLQVLPETLSLGSIRVGERENFLASVENLGSEVLHVLDVRTPRGIRLETALPLSLSPTESLDLRFVLQAVHEGPFQAEVTLVSNDPYAGEVSFVVIGEMIGAEER